MVSNDKENAAKTSKSDCYPTCMNVWINQDKGLRYLEARIERGGSTEVQVPSPDAAQ